MIPEAAITAWSGTAPWATPEQVEQDLILSRVIVEVANDAYLGRELAFRGGTCLHKLYLPRPLRYSEDLDYVRTTSGGIGETTRAITAIGERLGMSVRTKMSEHPKVFLRGSYEGSSSRMRVKVEINTKERDHAKPLVRVPYQVDSPWFRGSAEVLTFSIEDLIATKIRALYQRSKGRDLFDMWLALSELGIAGTDVVRAFEPYRPAGYSRKLAIGNLREKVTRAMFREDLQGLVVSWPPGYSVEAAAEEVIDEVLARIDDQPSASPTGTA